MVNSLRDDQVDQLQQYLIVPLAVADILKHDLDVEPEMQYGLHMALSEIDPDSALLAIALCASNIATKCFTDAHIAQALSKEAENIITEYAPTWLRYHNRGPMPEAVFAEILETVPEDLEALADLLDALCADIDNDHCSTAMLASLLSIQARAHMEIADFILLEMQAEKATGENREAVGDGGLAPGDSIDMDAYKGNNIILFPGIPRH
jgi:hypothetical protein